MRAIIPLLAVLLAAVCGTVAMGAESVRFNRLSVEEGLSQATVQAIVQDSVGFVWLGTQQGLNRYDG